MRQRAEANGLSLTLDFGDDVPSCIVGDAPRLRQIIEMFDSMPRLLGVQFETAALAAEISAKRNVVFAILDLTVPGGKGGTDIIADAKSILLGLPVFVTSGYADNPAIARPQEFGFTGSICKPFSKQELCELLEKRLTPRPA